LTSKKRSQSASEISAKGLNFEDAEVVDKHIGSADLLQETLHASGSAEIRGDAAEIGSGNARLNGFEGGVDASLRAAVYHDLRALRGERGSNRQADASR